MMALWIAFAIFLMILGAFLLVLEVFIPSFGLLTILSATAGIGAVLILFNYGPQVGWTGVALGAVIVPVVWYLSYKLLTEKSPLSLVNDLSLDATGEGIPDNAVIQGLQGQVGLVVTPLRPVGMCDFRGRRVACVAETGYIEKGRRVRVIEVDGPQLTVRLEQDE